MINSPRVLASLGSLMLLSLGSAVGAEPPAPRAMSAPEERFELRVQGGASIRNGGQVTQDVDLTYAGTTPIDFSLSGWAWLLLDEKLGAMARVGRESFGLYQGSDRLTQIGLLRAQVGPTYRFRFGPVRLEPVVGYAFEQIASFTQVPGLAAQATARHALLLAGRVSVDIGPVALEARGEYPVALATVNRSLTSPRSSGFSAGGGVRFPVWSAGALRLGGIAELVYSEDSVRQGSVVTAAQSLLRAGVAVDVRWQVAPTPLTGTVRLKVVDAQSKAPLAKAVVLVQASSGAVPATLEPGGEVLLSDVGPGALVAKATLDGYEPGELTGDVKAGVEVALTLAMVKVVPTTGGISLRVVNRADGAAVAGAKVVHGSSAYVTDAAGRLTLPALPPGPVALTVEAESFLLAQESAMIVVGMTSEVLVQLLPAKKRIPATLSGRVRNAQGGAPIQAELVIVQASIKASADAMGVFSFLLPGGTYTISISAPGYTAQTKSVTVKDAEQAIFNVDLSPLKKGGGP